MSTATPEPTSMLLGKYAPTTPPAASPSLTASDALAALVERHDTTESIRERQVVTERIREVLTDVRRTEETQIRAAQKHVRKRADVCTDARDVVAEMEALAASTDPIGDEVLANLDTLEDLSRRIEAAADRLTSEASWLAEKLEDPVKALSTMQAKFPTIKRNYL